MNRLLKLPESNNFFLFGARATGKTWILKERLASLGNCLYIDLLSPRDFDALAQRAELLSERIAALPAGRQWVVIDEVQRLPQLLNVVHLEIEAHSRTRMGVSDERLKGREVLFALTGSSARKLKRGRANLLAGRAFVRHLYPLTHRETPSDRSLLDALQWGGLPRIVSSESVEERSELLLAYVHTYLHEEILAEQIAREIPPFRRFLQVAAQSNGDIVNYSSVARDIAVSPNTVQNYFQVLEDTLVAYQLPPFHESIRKRQQHSPKYYFFDPGVQRALMGIHAQPLTERTYGFGKAFEHHVFLEIYRLASYGSKDFRFSYLRTKDDLEIDLVIERPGFPRALVEIKSTERIQEQDLRALIRLGGDIPNSERFCLSRDPRARLVSNVHVLPWMQGIRELGL